eukprot:GHVU01022418.1.p1 GENE.GHVU01022418.1~~GHVU01022418.1.p1  ORF type:complete len:119 (+),score=32.19 GHVU01022418.1:51-407(+)
MTKLTSALSFLLLASIAVGHMEMSHPRNFNVRARNLHEDEVKASLDLGHALAEGEEAKTKFEEASSAGKNEAKKKFKEAQKKSEKAKENFEKAAEAGGDVLEDKFKQELKEAKDKGED